MKRILLFALVVLTLFAFSSCNLDDDGPNFNFVALRVLSAEVPDAFDLNETHKITVTYSLPDGCTTFRGFEIDNPDTTTRNVVVIGSQRTDLVCTQLTDTVEASFDFTVLFSDTYLFRFWTGEDENGEQQYLEIEVPVNDPTN
ncbi:hypothetical protein [Spongiimicrobium sp. 3-5]|uniref:hypothetical protein n=1 Tax=Spongiimicrobium sp. 3-5 TaxID=3332596 RepID=UPI003980E990